MNGLNEIMHAKNVAIGIAHLRGSVNVSNHWCFEIPIKKNTGARNTHKKNNILVASYALNRKTAYYGLWAKSYPLTVFGNGVVLGHGHSQPRRQ